MCYTHDTKAGSYFIPRSVAVSSDIYSLILIAFSKLDSGVVQLNSTRDLVCFSMQGSDASFYAYIQHSSGHIDCGGQHARQAAAGHR